MAKKKPVGQKTKAEAIREFAAKNPGMRHCDIIKAFADEGIRVSSGEISTALNGKRSRGAKKGEIGLEEVDAAAEFLTLSGLDVTEAFEQLQCMEQLVERTGSVERAVKSMARLAKFRGIKLETPGV